MAPPGEPSPSEQRVQEEAEFEQELFYVSLPPTPPDGTPSPVAPSPPETIILLHGVLCSHVEWAHVAPYLQSAGYEVLIPDLPGHSRSASILPARIPYIADAVASLLRRRAQRPTARVHVVGLSMGGFVSLSLARRHPDLVSSVFVTGAAPFRGWFAWISRKPRVVWWCLQMFITRMPDWLYWRMARWQGMVDHRELRAEMKANVRRYDVVRDVYTTILDLDMDAVKDLAEKGKENGWKVLTVAGGQQDQVDSTRDMGRVMKEVQGGNKAVVVKKALHAWDLQFPELLARGVVAWIQGEELPPEFEELV